MLDTLGWLWDTIAEPVLEALGFDTVGSVLPRLWWCPTAELSFLPLHAAGRGGRSVLNRVVSSYAPTLRSIRRSAPVESASESALLVAVSRAPHVGQLPVLEIRHEVAAFRALFPAAAELVDGAAVADAVLAALAHASIVHVACHAYQYVGDPSSGALVFWDRPVTVRELRQSAVPEGRLAVLLGCETARGGLDLADEAITLSTAFQLAGYTHAIGAMWLVSDGDAAHVATTVYRELSGFRPGPVADGDATARALHAAVRDLRDRHPFALNRWAGFVHAGP